MDRSIEEFISSPRDPIEESICISLDLVSAFLHEESIGIASKDLYSVPSSPNSDSGETLPPIFHIHDLFHGGKEMSIMDVSWKIEMKNFLMCLSISITNKRSIGLECK